MQRRNVGDVLNKVVRFCVGYVARWRTWIMACNATCAKYGYMPNAKRWEMGCIGNCRCKRCLGYALGALPRRKNMRRR
ncbi:hypothetical protein E2C01_070020 [Portunus trituberculatus]|uniref:Uncharacterized protein n=1 Tax=Portunus trituberculatus TaxID=210409 RepID=A0A5B7I2G0_PORTR|nr:hypothetical protein [Portunus trituberculatus]